LVNSFGFTKVSSVLTSAKFCQAMVNFRSKSIRYSMGTKKKSIELLSDQAIANKTEDKFDRIEFVKSVGEIIKSQSTKVNPEKIPDFKDVEENMIIGLYGAWGFGKSSVLNLLKEDLESRNVNCVFFNPWMYGSEAQLLASLFNTIISYSGLKKDGQEKLIKLLERYQPLVSSVSNKVGELMQGLQLAIKPKEETNAFYHKQEIDKILCGMANPLVIFIDDVDRLSKDEIHLLFKTLRLIASFKHVIYVIACDYEMVSKSIKDNYAGGNIDDGRSFIDKIIQIPIRIPEIKPKKLANFASEYLKKTTGIDISDNKLFVQIIQYFFRTPRDVKRFINGFRFTQEYIGNSVLPEDLIFLELIRVKIYDLFEIIRIYYSALLSTDSNNYFKKEVDKFLKKNKAIFFREDGSYNSTHMEFHLYEIIVKELFNLHEFKSLTYPLGRIYLGFDGYSSHESVKNLKSLKNPRTLIKYFEKSDSIKLDATESLL
jgi:hypothetical protein